MRILRSAICITAILTMLLSLCTICHGAEFSEELDCKSAILIEQSTGRVLYEKNADKKLPPASVTKIMTLLLVVEALEDEKFKLTDEVPVSEYAASMGGSQVFLKVGEKMSVSDMIKSVTVASANDCAVALAEFVCGSESAFVSKMNERAAQLGMKNTTFKNVTGLDDTDEDHLTSARDIAIMSAELMKHEIIFNYTTIWMDTIRDGQFGLTNTNKLIRFYHGANGLKTGSTSKAKFCISAAAKRDGMQLIAVIMASPSSDVRNECAKKLLDFGFANYGIYEAPADKLEPLSVKGANEDHVSISHGGVCALLEKSKIKDVRYEIELPEYIAAPVKQGDTVGKVIFYCENEKIGTVDIVADCTVEKISYFQMLWSMLKCFFMT